SFFYTHTATSDICTLSLHDALPIWAGAAGTAVRTPGPTSASAGAPVLERRRCTPDLPRSTVETVEARPWEPGSGQYQACESSPRSEEHTSELQSRGHLVCRLLLEKK